MKKDIKLFDKTEQNIIKLINNFCCVITDDEESVEDTIQRFIGLHYVNVAGIFELADMFLSLNNVIEFYLLEVDVDTFINWYWWDLENKQDNRQTLNLENYLKNLQQVKKEEGLNRI